MAVELHTRSSILSPFPEPAPSPHQVKNLDTSAIYQPADKIKCWSGRVLSHWAENRTSTQNDILIWRILCAAGRYFGASATAAIFGTLGTLWHTAAAVVEAAAFLIAGLIYLPTRLFSKSSDPQADWQVTLEKFTVRHGENAIKHLGSMFVDMMRCTGIGTFATAIHFAASPEDYEPNKALDWTQKPSFIDTAIPAILYSIFD
jgi:hypothetical protein